MTSERVSGHTLRNEGAAFERRDGHHYRINVWSTFGDGYGLCSCGARSPILSSGGARKRWHREHKAEILASDAATRSTLEG